MVRHAELKEQADSLPRGSAERKTLEKRISHLEQYRLRKEDERDGGQREDVFDESGKKIGERHSVRKRTIAGQSAERRSYSPTGAQTSGGAQSRLLQASDGALYVTKFQDSPQHLRVFANEMLATNFSESAEQDDIRIVAAGAGDCDFLPSPDPA